MSEAPSPTRKRIVDAATKLFYAEGIGRVSVDAIAEKAGLTKRTLYYHFKSKDDLIAAYLDGRDQPNLKQMAGWFETAEGGAERKVEAIFTNLARVATPSEMERLRLPAHGSRTRFDARTSRPSRPGRGIRRISRPGWPANSQAMASTSRRPWRAKSCF